MKHYYLFLLLFLTSLAWKTHAQSPDLPVKASLSTTLSSSKTFNNSTSIDTIALPLSNKDEFTIDVNVQVNSAVGRGFDVAFNNEFGLGLRTSLDETLFNNSSLLSQPETLSISADNGQVQTYRYAVKNGIAHIFQDGHYLTSKSLSTLEGNTPQALTFGADNYLGAWAGTSGNNSGKPSDYAWANTYSSTLFNTANGGGGVRYMDITSGHTYESDNSVYNGRLMYIRWDGSAYVSSTYSYPIELEYGYQYDFSFIYELIANAGSGAKINVAISTNADGSGAIASKSFTSGNTFKLRNGAFSFLSQSEGTHYLTITGDWGLFGIGELELSSTNLINQWDGFAIDNAKMPSIYGWTNTYASLPWETANAATGMRYIDVTSGHTFESNGSTYSGRLMYIDWNHIDYASSTYAFPIDVKEGKDYKFSWIYELISGTPGAEMTVAISASQDGSAPIMSKTFTTSTANVLRQDDLLFQPPNDGTFYITITGDGDVFAIGKLGLKEALQSKIIIGKNYASGAVDIVVNYVTYEETAYLPTKIDAPSAVSLNITSDQNVSTYAKSQITLGGSASLYLSNAYNPLINTTVDLTSEDARIVFKNVNPTTVTNSFLDVITVNGAPAANNTNVTILGYGAGTAIVPHTSDYQPLEVFTEENFGGTSQRYQIVTPHTDLGAFDNNIKSIKLKKGYMATFASNTNGSGYSRVFIAQDSDVEIAVLPPYLNGTISFIRTMRWNDVSKKGWCGSGTALTATNATNSTWRYNWDTGGATTASTEYVPMRHNLYWPGFGPANTYGGYTHFLGYNEPDRPDQANITVATAINGWPSFLESGLRLGSPSTSDPFNAWLGEFMTAAEANNYRVDYMALHCYWYKSASQWASDLQYIYDKYQRPIWITEWNIGANWTDDSFPDGPTLLTDANATKHKNDLIAILNVLDTKDYVERYSLYNWVQDARAMIVTINASFMERNTNYTNYQWLMDAPIISTTQGTLPDGSTGDIHTVLTPAGAYYANNASKKAYNPNREFITTWTPKTESLSYELSPSFDNITIEWTDNNFDLVNKYVLERKLEGETEFTVFYETTDYATTSTIDVIHTKAEYRLKVIGKDDVASAYSSTLIFQQSVIPEVPTNLAGEALSSTIINLTWFAVTGAEGYNLKRATAIDGTYETVVSAHTGTRYEDTNLIENTRYYYKISALNSGGESTDSAPLTVTTLTVSTPNPVANILMGSGDDHVKFEWDTMYDAQFYIKRSTSASGPFTTIATVSENSYEDITATNGTVYYYKISAFNTAGESTASNILTATPNLGQHAHYGFEENTGLKALDRWGNYTANVSNATWTTAGKVGNAVNLNGTSSYIDLKDGVMENLTDFTISTWLKLNTTSTWMRIFDFGTDTSHYMFLTPKNGTDGRFRFGLKNGDSEEQINANIAASNDVWTHISITLSGSQGIMYIDGVEVGRNDAMTLTPANLGYTTKNYIGKSQYPDPYLDAIIDEFIIYNRALNPAEVAHVMHMTLDTNDTVLSDNSKYTFYTVDNSLNAIYNSNEDTNYRLYTVSGKLVAMGKLLSRGVTNLGTYNTGIYVVHIDDANDVNAVKVIVKP